MDWCKILIIAIVIASIAAVLYLFFGQKRISPFSSAHDLGYANDMDPYETPFILKNFLTRDHCRQIIKYAKERLVDSEVVGGKMSYIRNSKQTWINKNHPLAKPLFEKASKMFNIPMENAEDLQVVRYQPNQYYKEHHDSCCDSSPQCVDFARKGGQRKLTVLAYLNDDFEDGSTYFKNLDLKIKPKPGDALVFFPLAKNSSKCHPKALHAGMPVKSGEKWIANLWFRERAFH